jgi:hypothetical protein
MIKHLKLYGLLLFIFLFAACKKQLDVNLDNPNGIGAPQVPAKSFFASALDNTTRRTLTGYYSANLWMGQWARSGNYSPATELETFNLTNAFQQGNWQASYKNIYDYNLVISKSPANSLMAGASEVMKAYVFQTLVDTYGNVPYKEASNPEVTARPKYDTAEVIYKDLVNKITAAQAVIKGSTPSADDIAGDILFKGDKTKWLKFSNTLKLRMLIRQLPKASAASVQAEIAKIVSEGSGFLGAGEDAGINPGYADVVGQQSPLWNSIGLEPGGTSPKENNNYYRANKSMTDFLQSVTDPRLNFLFKANNNSGYDGNFFGETATARQNSVTSGIGAGLLKSATMPAILMTASESFFLQAEAAQRAVLSGNVDNLYKQAVQESFRLLGVPNAATAADNFVTTTSSDLVNITSSTNKIKTIIQQKWVALCGLNGLEVWSEFRRTGFPDRTNPSKNPSTVRNQVPKRLLYPQSEYDLNEANVKAQGQITQTGPLYQPIFWAQ